MLIVSFVSKVWNIRNGNTICEEELFGFLRYKFKVGQPDNNAQVQVDKVCSIWR